MSRICVKNLPKHVAEDRLRDVFSQKGEVTDAKLMRTKDGRSRQFAFIGFRTEAEAQEALNYFNNSFIDTSKITCEIARKVGDPNIPRPWSRYSSEKVQKLTEEGTKVTDGKSLSHESAKGEKKNHKKGSDNDEPKLQEFLQVMQPRSKSKLWANDTLGASLVDQHEGQQSGGIGIPAASEGNTDKVGEHKNRLKETNKVGKSQNIAHDNVISDMEYFKSRVKQKWSDSETESSDEECNAKNEAVSDQDDDDDDDNGSGESLKDHEIKHTQKIESEENVSTVINNFGDKVKEESSFKDSNGEVSDSGGPSDQTDEIFETSRLFIRNLPYTATEDELEELFSKYGKVSQVHLIVDKQTKRSKGFAYVLFDFPEAAGRAFGELDNSIFQGRLLHVMPAKLKVSSEEQDNNACASHSSKTFKQLREEAKKESEASGDTRAWNSLFIRPDTVVENIARKLGVNKSDLLDREADDLAVRIALGETQVVAETKKALASAGVNVAAIEELAARKTDGMKRSNHILLAKNLPYGSSEGELAKMFGKFGSLDKIILPPTKALALVVFLEASEARAAFSSLAYKQYKGSPLYLEWPPANILSHSPALESDPKDNAFVNEQDAKRIFLDQNVEGLLDVDVDPDRVESRSLYVKNLNFKTSDESLKTHFSEHIKNGRIMSVKIKKHLKNEKYLSTGFGFIEFDSVETATNVCQDLQGTVLDGHALLLELCRLKKDEKALRKVGKDRSSTKILARNIAFEATEKDLRQLFSPFGQIKSLRLPKKLGNHRGFAFVEYVTKQEAQNALQALSSTHLYGRHLLLEMAKEGETLEELRARTAAQFAVQQNGLNGPSLSKKRKQTAILDEGSVKFQRIVE